MNLLFPGISPAVLRGDLAKITEVIPTGTRRVADTAFEYAVVLVALADEADGLADVDQFLNHLVPRVRRGRRSSR